MKTTTFDDVITKFDDVIASAMRDSDRVGYFAALYRTVTVAIRDAARAGEFLDAERMQRYDVAFANRYFDALEASRANRPLPACWRVAFDACKRREPTILQHMFVGLAAHQLLDLATCAAEVAPGAQIFDLHKDFLHINEIVARLMPEIDALIGKLSPRIGTLDRIAGAPYAAFNKLGIATARDMAWRSAVELAHLDEVGQIPVIAAMDRRAARIAEELARPRVPLRFIASFIRAKESDDVAATIRALAGPSPVSPVTTAATARRRVIVLGGGIGGLTAAHELVARGFEVDVYEASAEIGGKAKSQGVPGTGVGGRPDLPGEHGFRFFPSFYRHVIDTMSRIPVPEGTVADRIRRSDEIGMAEEHAWYRFQRHPPRDVGDFFQVTSTVREFFATSHVREVDVARFGHAMLRYMTSCDERRLVEAEQVSFWDYIGGERYAPTFQKYLDTPRFMVAMDPRHGSARTVATKAIQILLDFFRNGTRTDGVLDGPTTERWLVPWYEELVRRGVRFHFGKTVERLLLDGVRLSGVQVSGEIVHGDHYVLALPLDRVVPLVSDELVAADPALAGLRRLKNATSWMVGAQFFFSRELEMCRGHVAYPDSAWALSSVAQGQFWKDELSRYGAGNVRDILSVDVSEWTRISRRIGKRALDCSREEVLDEVWAQLEDGLKGRIDTASLVARHLDLNVRFEGGKAVHNETPLLVHPPGSWFDRPGADLAIENLVLASDYVKTNTDLASMEGANEAARRAVNAILAFEGRSAEACRIWSMEEETGPLVQAARRIDRDRFLLAPRAPRDPMQLGGGSAEVQALTSLPTLSALRELEESIRKTSKLRAS